MSSILLSEALKKPGLYWIFRDSWRAPLKIRVIKTANEGTLVQTTEAPFYLIDTEYQHNWIAFDNFWLAYAEALKRGGSIYD